MNAARPPVMPEHIEARAHAFALVLAAPRPPFVSRKREPDAECIECHAPFYSAEGHPTIALCGPCWRPSR